MLELSAHYDLWLANWPWTIKQILNCQVKDCVWVCLCFYVCVWEREREKKSPPGWSRISSEPCVSLLSHFQTHVAAQRHTELSLVDVLFYPCHISQSHYIWTSFLRVFRLNLLQFIFYMLSQTTNVTPHFYLRWCLSIHKYVKNAPSVLCKDMQLFLTEWYKLPVLACI